MVATRSSVRAKNAIETKSPSNMKRLSIKPTKPLPVTLLSGFLGSGKTTLLQHILQNNNNLRIAVIVNDIGAINIDASLIRNTHRLTKTKEKVIALQNGCICCTLRGDLLEQLIHLAELAEFDYVVIESSGISEPEQVAETFDARLAEKLAVVGDSHVAGAGLDEATLIALERLKAAGGIGKFAKLDTTVTVVDAFTIFNEFETDELLSSRRDDVVPEDERTISDLMVDQIEFADVIILNKIDMINQVTRARIKDLITKLNPRAKLLESRFSRIAIKEILDTGLFSMERAQTGYGWLQDLHSMTLQEVNGRKTVTPKSETDEYNVRNFVYTARRPFHPLRLYQLIYETFILRQQFDDEDVESESDEEDCDMSDISEENSSDGESDDFAPAPPENATILANKKAHPLFAKVFRSKGEIWLATRPDRAGEWSQAGAMLTIQGGRPWFCTIDDSEWRTGSKAIDELVEHDISSGGIWGDRRQELVFIGEGLNHLGIEKELNKCLVTDVEWRMWQDIMTDTDMLDVSREDKMDETLRKLADIFPDGFQDWEDEHEDHDGHTHDHAHR